MKKKLFIPILLLVGALSVEAQYNSFWSLNFQVTQGVGEVGKYIGSPSTVLGEVEGKYFINPKVALGGKFAWSELHEKKERDTYKISEDISVNSVQRRYLYSMPIMANISWFPLEYDQDNKIHPYASFGIGTIWSRQETLNGLYYEEEPKKQFSIGINPELGIIFRVNKSIGVNAKVGYILANLDSLDGSIDGKLPEINYYSVLNYSLGITFLY